MIFFIKDFFSKCDQICRKLRILRIWSHLLKKSLMKNFIFCAVSYWNFPAKHILPFYIYSHFHIFLFLPTELFLMYPILMKWRLRDIDIIWTNILYNILSTERELTVAYQQTIPVRKKMISFLRPKCFHWGWLLAYGKCRRAQMG